jgi:hypothetical protein
MAVDNFQPFFEIHAAIVVVAAKARRKAFLENAVGTHQADRPPWDMMPRSAVAVDAIDHESLVIARDPVPNSLVFQGQIRAQDSKFLKYLPDACEDDMGGSFGTF